LTDALAKRHIGSLEVSVVGLGCNNFGGRIDEHQTAEVVSAALDAGITFFDTADIYGGTRSEELLGRALGKHRDEVMVATKFGMPVDAERTGAKPAYVRRAVEESLRRLRTDHVDLYQLHRPDPETPMADTLAALDELVRAGKVREIGCSNFSAAQIREAQAAVRQGAARFISVQNEYSLLKREPELEVLPECDRLALAFIPYFPLSSGVLTGKYRRGEPPPSGTRLAGVPTGRPDSPLSDQTLSVVEALEAFAARNGHSVLELAIAWLVMQPTVASVIAGATAPVQVRANAKASSWVLTAAQLDEVDEVAPAH
jgi:aryl-alcohol dehydrogenase-like predicted oxidoreductase